MPRSQTLSLGHRHRGNLAYRLVALLAKASLRHRQRQALARLDDHLLRDIGLDSRIVAEECAKPVWRD